MTKTIYNADKIVSVHYIKPIINEDFIYREKEDIFLLKSDYEYLPRLYYKQVIGDLDIIYKKTDFGINKTFNELFVGDENYVWTQPKVEVYFDNQESYTMKFDNAYEAVEYCDKITLMIPKDKQIEVDI